jgi:hypothetical protein
LLQKQPAGHFVYGGQKITQALKIKSRYFLSKSLTIPRNGTVAAMP